MNGKGDRDRTANRSQYETNYDLIFKKPPTKKQPDAPYRRFKAILGHLTLKGYHGSH
jgi:hypothetical protein